MPWENLPFEHDRLAVDAVQFTIFWAFSAETQNGIREDIVPKYKTIMDSGPSSIDPASRTILFLETVDLIPCRGEYLMDHVNIHPCFEEHIGIVFVPCRGAQMPVYKNSQNFP